MSSIEGEPPSDSFAGFSRGALLLIDGVRFIRRERGLWLLAFVPVLFTVFFVGVAIVLFWAQLDWVHETWVALLPTFEVGDWWTWIWVGPGRALSWIIGWLAVLVSFAVALVSGLLVANLASAPFLDVLSQRVEAIELGDVEGSERSGLGALVLEALSSFAAELQRLIFLAGIWAGLSVIGIVVPGAQLITAPLLIAFTILFLPLNYAGFALDRRGLSFARRRAWLLDHRSLMLGFGGVAFVACLIPGVNLLILPAQVTAGTLLVLRQAPPN